MKLNFLFTQSSFSYWIYEFSDSELDPHQLWPPPSGFLSLLGRAGRRRSLDDFLACFPSCFEFRLEPDELFWPASGSTIPSSLPFGRGPSLDDLLPDFLCFFEFRLVPDELSRPYTNQFLFLGPRWCLSIRKTRLEVRFFKPIVILNAHQPNFRKQSCLPLLLTLLLKYWAHYKKHLLYCTTIICIVANKLKMLHRLCIASFFKQNDSTIRQRI